MSTEHPDDPGHGDSVAAWTAVIIIIVASAGATLAVWFGQTLWVLVSFAVMGLGVVAGIVLSKLGFGVKRN
ncbi:MAG: hypothetical protein RLZZ400_638 [Actinomycetota bacterium]|jgi:hypothetical protein